MGVHLNRNGNIFKYHMDSLTTKGKSKINAIKIIANEGINRIWTADALWKGAARPAILYASEAIKFNQTDMKKLESLQGDMGRWILKGNGGMPNVGIRGELGWKTINGEAMRRKIAYYGKIAFMHEDRWIKQIWRNMHITKKSKWLSEVQHAAKELGVKLEDWKRMKNFQEWKKHVDKKTKQWEDQAWLQEREELRSLECYPKRGLTDRERYLDDSEESRIMTRLRLNNVQWNITTEQGKLCRACNTEKGGLTHMLLDCPATNKKHEEAQTVAREGVASRITSILADKTKENMCWLAGMYKTWEREANDKEVMGKKKTATNSCASLPRGVEAPEHTGKAG